MGAVLLEPAQIVISLLLAYTAYLVGLAVYRLYFHPLARFPGPKSAAISTWPDFYHDAIGKGKFTFVIDEWHNQYGPIVRISPDEIHIKDSQFYDTIYTKAGRVDKYEWTASRFNSNMSIFTTSSADLHATRRNALSPLFSRARIIQLENIIRDKIDVLLRQARMYQQDNQPFNIDRAYMSYAGDVIMRYCFGMDYDHLSLKGWKVNLHNAFMASMLKSPISIHFPIVPRVMNSLPQSWVKKLDPLFSLLFQLQSDLDEQVAAAKNGEDFDTEKSAATVIQTLLQDPDLPLEQKENLRLSNECQVLCGAAVTTTGRTLSVGTFHILNNSDVYARLRRELEDTIPDPSVPLRWTQLEKLPYLTACIRESLRLAYPVSGRSQRLLSTPVTYGDWTIPARTPVSMTINDISNDEDIFPDHQKFKPERWINPPKTPDGSSLDRYLIAFQKGTRSCLGLKNFRLELVDTDESDVAFAHDYFASVPRLDSKGVWLRCLPEP